MVAIKTANLFHRSKKGDRLYLIFMNIAIGLLFIILVYSMYLAMNMCSPEATGANVCQQINVEVPDPSNVVTAEEMLAKCLTQEGAVMYGAFWCGNCKNQKMLFGDSFKYVAYVECTENPDICTERGILAYPTWIIDGEARIGEFSLQALADMTGCEYLY